MKEENKGAAVIVVIGLLPTVIVGLSYAKVVRDERKKRKKIDEWQRENLACIEKSRQELLAMIDAGASWDEVMAKMAVDREFLTIVREQIKY